jgi:hypothetical protein
MTSIGHVCVDKNLIRGEIETFYGVSGRASSERAAA